MGLFQGLPEPVQDCGLCFDDVEPDDDRGWLAEEGWVHEYHLFDDG